MPSSISNSDVPYRRIPQRNWGRAWLICVLLVAVAMAGWEIQARSTQHLPGTHDAFTNFTIQWAEERRKLDEPGHNIRLVLLGSSRVLWAADLDIMEQRMGTRPLQLAIAGTGPALMFEDLVNNTDFDGLVVIGVTPFLFNRLDEGFFGGDALRWYRGASPSERISHAIHTFLSMHFGFLDDSFKLFQMIDHYSQLPVREGALNLASLEWKLGDHYADRQTDMWPPIEIEGSFDNEQILAFWMLGLGRPPEPPEKMTEMAEQAVAFFQPLVDKLRARGGDAIFIRMPGSGKYLEHDLETDYRGLTWDPMTAGFGAPAINTMDYPSLSAELEIPEWSHLSRKSQDDFSRELVPVLEEHYRRERGQSIYDLMKIPTPED